MLIETKTYQQWRTNNNPFILNSQPYFTGNLTEEEYQVVHDYIDKKFKTHFIGFEDDEEMLDEMQTKLKEIEFPFFSMYYATYKMQYDNIMYRTRDETSSGEYKGTSSSNENANSTVNGNVTSSSSSQMETSSDDNTISDNTSKGKVLSSQFPNSNVSSSITTDLDDPISWRYATDLTDSNTNTSTTTDTRSSGSSSSNSSDRTNSSNNATSSSNSNSTSSNTNNYTKSIRESLNPDMYYKFISGLQKSSCFKYLDKELSTLFLYLMRGVY